MASKAENPRASVKAAVTRLLLRAGLDGVVDNPADADLVADAQRHLRAAADLLERDAAIRNGDRDAPF